MPEPPATHTHTKACGCFPVGSVLWLFSERLRASPLTPGHLESRDWGDRLNEPGCFPEGDPSKAFAAASDSLRPPQSPSLLQGQATSRAAAPSQPSL